MCGKAKHSLRLWYNPSKSMKAILYILFAFVACVPATGAVLTSVGKANAIPLESITEPMDFAFTGTVLRANRALITFSDESDGTILFHATKEHGLKEWERIPAKEKLRHISVILEIQALSLLRRRHPHT